MEKEWHREAAGVGVMWKRRMGVDGGKKKLPNLGSEKGRSPARERNPSSPAPHKGLKPYDGGGGGAAAGFGEVRREREII